MVQRSATAAAAATTASKLLRTHLIFGANTDVGKTVVTAGLVRSRLASCQKQGGAANDDVVHYIKPLQCGGSDEAWVRKHVELPFSSGRIPSPSSSSNATYSARTLYRWEMAASPHLASRVENKPLGDHEVLTSLTHTLTTLENSSRGKKVEPAALIETAGGVLSPSAASPDNILLNHARGTRATNDDNLSWGWSTQADLYQPLGLPAILVGDGRLGGISCTLSALESLTARGYDVHGIVVVDDGGGYGNVDALREYASRTGCGSGERAQQTFESDPSESIVSLAPLPPEPERLDEWYQSLEVEDKLVSFEQRLDMLWEKE